MATDGKDAQRLSLHINDNGSFQGGHRCGAQKATYNDLGKDLTTFDADDAWELVFYHMPIRFKIGFKTPSLPKYKNPPTIEIKLFYCVRVI